MALPWTSGSAASLISTLFAQTIVATSSSDGTVTSTFGRLRNDLISVSSSSVRTITSGASFPHDSTRLLACFVEGASNAEPSSTPSVSFATWLREGATECGAARLAVHLDVEAAHHRARRRHRRP